MSIRDSADLRLAPASQMLRIKQVNKSMAGSGGRSSHCVPPLDTLPRPSESPAASRVSLCLLHMGAIKTEPGIACEELDPLCLTPPPTIAHLTSIIAHDACGASQELGGLGPHLSWGNINDRGEVDSGRRKYFRLKINATTVVKERSPRAPKLQWLEGMGRIWVTEVEGARKQGQLGGSQKRTP